MMLSEVEAVAAKYGLGGDTQDGSKITLAQETKEMLRYVLLRNDCRIVNLLTMLMLGIMLPLPLRSLQQHISCRWRLRPSRYLDCCHIVKTQQHLGVRARVFVWRPRYFTRMGLIIYHCDDPKLNDVIIMEPQWLIDAAGALIRDFQLHKLPGDDDARLYQEDKWNDLTQKGLLTTTSQDGECLLDHLWPTEPNDVDSKPISLDDRQFLLDLMQRYGLIVPLRITDSDDTVSSSSRRSTAFDEKMQIECTRVGLTEV